MWKRDILIVYGRVSFPQQLSLNILPPLLDKGDMMTFEEWWQKEGVTFKDEDECGYFSKSDMKWIAKLAWEASTNTRKDERIIECNTP